jgi:hypothetical protein
MVTGKEEKSRKGSKLQPLVQKRACQASETSGAKNEECGLKSRDEGWCWKQSRKTQQKVDED